MSFVPFRLPDIGEGITEARMVHWFVKAGDRVEEDQPICEIQTDKAVVELPSPCKGRIVETNWKPGELITVGETILTIETSEHETQEPKRASPSTRRLARELGVDLQQVQGTGEDGRIVDEDVRRFAKEREKPDHGETLPSIRKAIAKKLVYSVSTRAHATHFDEIDAEGLVMLRNLLKKEETISYTPILMKIVAETLKQHSDWNAHYDEERETLQKFDSISLGLATHTDQGLLVPVIHDVEKKSIRQLQHEIKVVVEQARKGRMLVSKAKGSTFTVSNVGGRGGTWATPIIQPPEVAILAIHPIHKKPVVLENGEIAARWTMNLSLSFDHRLFDGVDAIRFTQTMAALVRNPIKLLADLK